MHKVAQLKEISSTQININKLIKDQEFVVNSYYSEQTNYINKNIYVIQKEIYTNKKSALAWEILNEISLRKKSNKAKQKSISDNERIKRCHHYLKKLLGKNIQSTIHSKNSNGYVIPFA